nr:hypothetical protein BaRGS_005882 [Batillaria attramentaria]
MVPGKNTCWPEWTLEYSGYVMTGYPSGHGASEYICVDKSRGISHAESHIILIDMGHDNVKVFTASNTLTSLKNKSEQGRK